MTTRASVTWRYLARGKVKHALPAKFGGAPREDVAVCGVRETPRREWLGADPYGYTTPWHDLGLPECGRCVRVLDQIPFGVPVEHASAPGTAPTANSPESS